jgi:hypothetical protein
VATLNDAHATMHSAIHRLAPRVERTARETGVGPFPDVSGNVDEAVLVRAGRANRLRLPIGVASRSRA